MPKTLVPYSSDLDLGVTSPLALIVEEDDNATDPLHYLCEGAQVHTIILQMWKCSIYIILMQTTESSNVKEPCIDTDVATNIVEEGEY